MEEEWSRFKVAVLDVGEEVCRERRVIEGIRRKGSKWWREEIWKVVERKKECLLGWRTERKEKDLEEYRRMKPVVKRRVREAEGRAN